MKRLLTLLLLAPTLCLAQIGEVPNGTSLARVGYAGLMITNVVGASEFTSSEPPSYLFEEGFEGNGFENTWVGAVNYDPDYTGVTIDDAQTLRIYPTGTASYAYSTFTAQDEVWFYAKIHVVTRDASNVRTIFQVSSSTGTALGSLQVGTTGAMRVTVGSASSSYTISTISNGTLYHVWGYYKIGTGADAIGKVWFSTDGTKPPDSGNNYQAVTTGTVTAQAARIYCGSPQNITQEYVYDRIRVAAENIGSSPE